MKNPILIFLVLVLSQNMVSQSKSCEVLMEKISGKYSGACKDGLAHGKGNAIREDTYTGFFKNGLPHGKGKYLSKNGDVFRGQWVDGLKNGKGKLQSNENGKKTTLSG